MTDAVDRAAEVLIEHTRTRIEKCHCGWSDLGASHAEHVARALDAAGLLTKYPRLEIEGDWLTEVVDYHTCGAGPGSGAGHEPGCGSIPVARLVTPTHDRTVAARALREAADVIDEEDPSMRYPVDPETVRIMRMLRERASRIERGEP